MDIDKAGNEWQRCGDMDVMFDWLYDMSWDGVELENMRVACGQYGGPIGMVRDSRKMVVLRGGSSHPLVRIFNCAGRELARFMWEGNRIVALGWTNEQQLLIVDSTGQVNGYSIHGRKLPMEFSLGQAVESEEVAECRVYGSGVVALTLAGSLWAVTDLNDPRPQRMADVVLDGVPQCMEVTVSATHGVEVVLATGSSVFVVDAMEAVEPSVSIGTIVMMSVSPNGEFVGAFTEEGSLVVLASDFTQDYLTFEPPIEGPPLQMSWCGNDAVVLYFEGVIMLVGSFGDWLTFPTSEPVVLTTEMDGLRVISTSKHHFMRRVPRAMIDVFSEESTHGGRQLFLAREAFDSQDAQADKMLRDIHSMLAESINACIETSGVEFDTTKQRRLLKAACYGIAFCKGYPNSKLHQHCLKLRVLNTIREPTVGIPLTMDQMDSLTMPVVVARLVNAHEHLFALRVCEAVGMSQDTVLRHWACARISADESTTDDVALKDIIADKLSGCDGIRYATIAQHAQAQGRKELAALLLDYEACAADQVPLLVDLGEDQRALDRAVESGDTDLVYLTIFHMYKKMVGSDRFGDFMGAIHAKPLAHSLFLKYCKAQEPEVVEQVYLITGNSEGTAEMKFKEALSISLSIPDDPSGEENVAISNLRDKVAALLREASASYRETKKHDFQAKVAEEFALLRKDQAKLHHTTGRNMFVGLSTIDTIRQCIRLGNNQRAADLRRQFGISDKHFYWVKIRTLAEQGDWDALDDFASERRPPIGWEPFIQACVQNNAPMDRTGRFIDRIQPDSEAKMEWYARVGLHLLAARTAENLKNADMLTKIQGVVGANSSLGIRTAQMIDRLKRQQK
ncbi:hypothetical protein BSKO_00280 [Bryopsis sp. KO-2023]|nr:hypothetical protein BSKO_00280 [Bryopsis sp. KO-2023]